MGRATGIAKLITRLTNKSSGKIAGQVSAAGARLTHATGRAVGSLGKLAMGAAAGAAATMLNRNEPEKQIGNSSAARTNTIAASKAVTIIPDPIIMLPAPDLSVPLDGEIVIPETPASEVTTKEEVPVRAYVDPTTIVENYFNDETAPIPIAASIPVDTSFFASIDSLGIIRKQIDFLAIRSLIIDKRIAGLEDTYEKSLTFQEKVNRDNERRRDEEDIEKPIHMPPSPIDNAAGFLGAMVGTYLGRFVLPAMAMTGAALASVAADATEDDTETIAEKLSFLDDIERDYVTLAAAYAGAKGAGVIKNIKTAAGGIQTAVAGKTGVALAKAQSAVGATTTAVSNVAKKIKANPVVATMVGGLRSMTGWIKSFAKGLAFPLQVAKDLLAPIARMGGNILKGLLAKPIKWYVIIESLLLLIKAGEAYLIDPSVEKERQFHSDVKTTIADMINLIGGTYFGVLIGSAAGAAIGTMTLPVVGTIGGGVLGAVFGILFGEDLMKIVPLNVLIDSTYNYFVLNKQNAFNGILARMKNEFVTQITKFFKETGRDTIDTITGGGISMAKQKEITEEYGDLRGVDLAIEAISGIGTDENAVMFAMKDISSAEDYARFAEEYERKTGESLESALRSDLSGREYDRLQSTIKQRYVTASPKEEAIVRELQSIFSSTDTAADKTDLLYNTVQDVIQDTDIKVEKVKSLFEAQTGEDITTALVRTVGNEEANIIEGILNKNISFNENGNITVTGNETRDISFTESSIEQKAPYIIPVMIPARQRGEMMPPMAASNSIGGSGIDVARSSYSTSDSFLADYGFQT